MMPAGANPGLARIPQQQHPPARAAMPGLGGPFNFSAAPVGGYPAPPPAPPAPAPCATGAAAGGMPHSHRVGMPARAGHDVPGSGEVAGLGGPFQFSAGGSAGSRNPPSSGQGPPPSGQVPVPSGQGPMIDHGARPPVPGGLPDGVPDYDCPEEGNEVRRRLAAALQSGNSTELQAALVEARKEGVVYGPEIGRAREALLAFEARDLRSEATKKAEEAMESDNWWKLQAAMTMVSAVDLGNDNCLGRLKESQRAYTKRRKAIRGLQQASKARDTAKLRTAIEAALKVHVREPHVKNARDSLRMLESQATARQQLQKAIGSGCMQTLKFAIAGAEQPAMDPQHEANADLLRPAREELRKLALERLESLVAAADMDALSAALEDAGEYCVGPEEVAGFQERLRQFRERAHHRERLESAIREGGDRERLQAAALAAREAGLEGMDELRRVEAALGKLDARDQRANDRASAARELQLAAQGNDVERLIAALQAGEGFGIVGSEAAPARDRLSYLRSRASVSSDLEMAIQSGDIYRLRAVIAGARGGGVGEGDLMKAKAALQALELQAQARRGIEMAFATGNAESLQRAIQEAMAAGMPKQEVAQAEAKLQSMSNSHLGQQLRDAMGSGDVDRLRHVAQASASAGVSRADVDAAWERVRELESGSWLKREIQHAVASRDPARLQAAIKQGEAAGLDRSSDGQAALHGARAELSKLVAQRGARQELQLARASKNPYNIQAAIQSAKASGLDDAEIHAITNGDGSAGTSCVHEAHGASPAPATNPQLSQAQGPQAYLQAASGGPPRQPQPDSSPTSPGRPPTNPQLPAHPTAQTGPPTNPQLPAHPGYSPPTDPQNLPAHPTYTNYVTQPHANSPPQFKGGKPVPQPPPAAGPPTNPQLPAHPAQEKRSKSVQFS